jgi:hypothetical protein
LEPFGAQATLGFAIVQCKLGKGAQDLFEGHVMTEEEAKKKWCPNRIPNATSIKTAREASCIGSDCMAWRWDKYPKDEGHYHDRGHCGLAGEP